MVKSKTASRKNRGGKLSRSEIVTVRLDPKQRYIAELAARKHRRTFSSFIEWSLEETLKREPIFDTRDGTKAVTFGDEDLVKSLWDVDEADRFVKLAFLRPEWMNHEEQILWKLIKENKSVWRSDDRKSSNGVVIEHLRKHWETFQKVAQGELPPSELPRGKAPSY